MPGTQLSYEELLSQNKDLTSKIADVESFKRVFERAWYGSVFGIVKLDSSGIIQDINPFGAQLFGKLTSDVVDTQIQSYLNLKDAEEIGQIIHSVVSGQQQQKASKFKLLPPSGRTVFVNVEISEITDSKSHIIIVLQDVTNQEKYAEELEEKEFFLNQAQKIANLGHYVLDIASGSWTGSPELLKLMGISNQMKLDVELWVALVHPDDRMMMTTYFFDYVVKGKNPFKKEYRIVRLTDGETIWVLGKGELRLNDHGEPLKMVGTIQDISERKAAEAEINATKALYQDLVETSQDLIWQCDTKGNFVFVNHAWKTTLGFSPEEMIGHHFSEFIGLEQGIRDTAQFYELLKGGAVTGYESVHYHKNGAPVLLSLNIKTITTPNRIVTGIRGTARDITEKKKTEQLFREKSEELDRYFNTAIEMLCMTDVEGHFLRLNPEWSKVLGYGMEELLNEKFLDFVHPDDIAATLESINQLKIGNEVLNFINRYRCKNGTYKFIEWRSVLVGNIIYAAARDVSRRIELEDSLKQSNKDLREINVQKDKFLYIIAHDVRNPLHNVLSISRLLNSGFRENGLEDNYKLIQLLDESTHSMYELIENLLNWALSQTGKLTYMPSVTPLNELTQKTISQVLPMASTKSIQIINKVPMGVNVWADKTMMATVLRNLISNAVKFSHPGNNVEISYIQKSEVAIMEVRDYGIGIRPQAIAGLFMLENAYLHKGTSGEKGTGFGLPLCRELMKMQGGSIWAESEPGKGSAFFVELPIKQ
jgi:PAS domain S-box-containing protein